MKRFFSLGLLLLCLIAFIFGVKQINQSNQSEQAQILDRAVTRSIAECYALEGFYPSSLQYLEDNYGLTYDKESYFIDYQYIGANILPDVTILYRKND